MAAVCTATAVAVAELVRHRMRSSGQWLRAMGIVREFEEGCATPIAKLRQVADAMTVEMHAGLASEEGKLKMLITYVDKLPTGYGLERFGSSLSLFCYFVIRSGLVRKSLWKMLLLCGYLF